MGLFIGHSKMNDCTYYDEKDEQTMSLLKKWNRFFFSGLNNWENRLPCSFMRAAESEKSDSLCLIYNITETRMCAYSGYIALVKDKENPKLIFNSKTPTYVSLEEPVYNENGQYVFIQIYFPEFIGTLVIDVKNAKYAGIKHHHFEFCDVRPMEDDIVWLTNACMNHNNLIDERIDLNNLHWQFIGAPSIDCASAFQ